jgi:hypothetical protein
VSDKEIIEKLKVLNTAFKETLSEFNSIGIEITYKANLDKYYKLLKEGLSQRLCLDKNVS